MKVNKWIAITAIGCLAVMQIAAMHYGINGTFRTIIVGAIAGIAGLTQPIPKIFRKKITKGNTGVYHEDDNGKVVEVKL